jgi:serine/threonine-protein kinase OSR1/STK39
MSTGNSEPQHTEWPTDASQYELIGKIGQGAFASVWRASTTTTITKIPTTTTTTTTTTTIPSSTQEEQHQQQQPNHHDQSERHECAIKVLNLDHVDSNLSEIRLEVQAMRLSSHPNILACHTAFVVATDLWLVTQLMRKGSSLHCLQGARGRLLQEHRLRRHHQRQQQPQQHGINASGTTTPPTAIRMEDHIMYILHETLLGLQYIHENGQIHRDIKAGNILLDSNGDVRIADFGVSGWLVNAGTQQEKAKTFVGTPCWMVGVVVVVVVVWW